MNTQRRQRLEALREELIHMERTAKNQGRDLNPAERARLDAIMAEVTHAKVDQDIAAQVADLAGLGVRHPEDDDGTHRRSKGRTPTRWTKAIRRYGSKVLDPSGSIALPGFMPDEIADIPQRQTVLSLMPQQELDGTDRFVFLRETLRDNQATAVARGAIKPTSPINLEQFDDRCRTVATLTEAVDNVFLADIDRLEGFLEDVLRSMIVASIEDQIIGGDGMGENIEGLLSVSGTQSQPFTDDILTTLRKAVTKVKTAFTDSGYQPDAMILHPADAEALSLTTDDQGRFYFGGPDVAGTLKVWDTPIVESHAVTEGTAIVANLKNSVVVYSRDTVKVSWSESLPTTVDTEDTSLFHTNQRVYRAEARVGLAVVRPAAIVIADLSAAT